MSIKILTSNVCWGCMSADENSKNDRTAQPLADICKTKRDEQLGVHVCLLNISNEIKKNKFDFIGLQEATNWNQIFCNIPDMAYLQHKVKIGTSDAHADIVTFYDYNKYKQKRI